MIAVTTIAWICMITLGVAILLGLVRIATAEDAASRAIVGDLVFFSGIGIMMCLSVLDESSVAMDAAALASILGILATVALARILTRGRR